MTLSPALRNFAAWRPFVSRSWSSILGRMRTSFSSTTCLMPARLALLPALLVAKLAVVHEAADGRHRVGRHLDQVEATLARHLERIECRDDADLLPFLVDQPDLADADALIDARLDWSCNGGPPVFQLMRSAASADAPL